MQIRKFRNDEFVNREKEIEYLKKKFEKILKEILWLYGPKSTGKTTLIEYIIEKELLKEFHKMLNSLKNFNFCLDFWGKILSEIIEIMIRFMNSKEKKDFEKIAKKVATL